MPTVTMDPDVRSWQPINMWAMLRALINNGTPILTINSLVTPIVNGTNGTFVGQAGKGALLIDYGQGNLLQNTGTISNVSWGSVSNVIVPITASGAISPHVSSTYVIGGASPVTLTLAAPTSGADDGIMISITSNTALGNVVSAIGLLQTGTAAHNYVTFPTFTGGEVDLMAYQGKWIVMNSQSVSFQ